MDEVKEEGEARNHSDTKGAAEQMCMNHDRANPEHDNTGDHDALVTTETTESRTKMIEANGPCATTLALMSQ